MPIVLLGQKERAISPLNRIEGGVAEKLPKQQAANAVAHDDEIEFILLGIID
jgi:hypothetical protein